MINIENYEQKYFKYKSKYLNKKNKHYFKQNNLIGGGGLGDINVEGSNITY